MKDWIDAIIGGLCLMALPIIILFIGHGLGY
jgi:hypothetical protein